LELVVDMGLPHGSQLEPLKVAGSARPIEPSLGAASFPQVARPWRRGNSSALPNALTCDVEDYFQVSAFEHLVPKARWNDYGCRLPANMDKVLQLFADAQVSGTFFTLGWVAERFPEVIRRVVDAGHEIASHGMRHIRVSAQTRDEFRADATQAKRLLEDTGGQAVRGYRAASWSLDERTPWAYDVLREAGYEYSSSLYPVVHDHYGVPSAPTEPFYVRPGTMLEIPASTVTLGGRNWPAAGGGYFRLLPLPLSLWLLRRAKLPNGVPAVFYFHPWELDPDQPRMAGISTRTRFRHYVNLGKVESRLKRLLESFKWDRIDRIYLTGESRSIA
jgi:polysaccharide deacetylase family protein (PEP-CTERM system associated)